MNILELNSDCLGYILNYLPSVDYNNFAQVCQQFRNVFIEHYGKQNREFAVVESSTRSQLIKFCICRELVENLIIDLGHFDTSRTYRSFGCQTPINCFSTLCFALEGMISLKSLQIIQPQYMLNAPIEKPFEQIFSALKNLNELKILEIRTKNDWSFDNLWLLRHLEELQLLVPKIPSTVLVKCCKSNPNLNVLQLGYDCVQGNLKDIVPHCGKLETLKFGMMAEAAAYKPLAKLPKLKRLLHYGIRRKGSFEPVLSALAMRPQLQQLEIDGGSLSPEEILQIVRLSGLQQLKCFCLTAECVEILSHLKHLQQLSVWMSSRPDISNALLKVVRECKELQLLRVATGVLSADFINDVAKLLASNRREMIQPPLQLEIPIPTYTLSIDQFSFRNSLLNCSPFEEDSWKL
ncbi:uncharacterized protein LOC117570842 isoform X1 [Drosophila albomicans]|uniref:Uncharacterized protein LOC117570842 isoform X1 n=1 Tax=Drosophila albomicans TaxID=7291 RepID=A0A6P8X994_DROAB|nr:uncharacterized protein LOC117570842 isoform X1 [Drosophila albomicans]XP_034108614.1 uncharacterized protein LOC117570842 isoform X1 [Drosophila albomicans]